MHLANASHRLGRTREFDPATQRAVSDEEVTNLLRVGDRGYRMPFVIPNELRIFHRRFEEGISPAVSAENLFLRLNVAHN